MWEFFALNALIDRFNSDSDYGDRDANYNPSQECEYCGGRDIAENRCRSCGAASVRVVVAVTIPALDSD